MTKIFFQFYLHKYQRIAHFILTGATGVILNMLITWLLTEFVFGTERYIIGYLIGASANVLYNFTLHSILTFKTKKQHRRRFTLFVLYSLGSAMIQIIIVNILTGYFGREYYLPMIAGTILFLSIISYILFKHSLFNEGSEKTMPTKEEYREMKNRIKTIGKSIFSFFLKDSHIVIVILVLAFLTRAPFLSYPNKTLFDEAIYTNYTIQTIDQVPLFDIHPPLARMLFAKIIEKNHQTLTLLPLKTGEGFGDFPYVTLRTFVMIFGILLPLIIYAIGRMILLTPAVALIPSLFIIFDNAFVIYSRTILPDMLMLVANFAGVLCILIALKIKQNYLRIYAIIAAGIFLGLAISIKWTALGILGLTLLWLLVNRLWKHAIAVFGIALFVYVSIFYANFSHFTKGGFVQPLLPAYSVDWINNIAYPPGDDALSVVRFIPEFHNQMFLSNSDPEITSQIMTAPKPMAWPIARSSIRFWEDNVSGESIVLTGNSLLWFGLFFMFLFEIGWIIFAIFQYRRWPIDQTETMLVLGYIMNFLPFFFIHRPMFLYHYFPSLIILFLLAPKITPRIIHCINILAHDKYIGYVIIVTVCIFAFFNFILLSPTTYGF